MISFFSPRIGDASECGPAPSSLPLLLTGVVPDRRKLVSLRASSGLATTGVLCFRRPVPRVEASSVGNVEALRVCNAGEVTSSAVAQRVARFWRLLVLCSPLPTCQEGRACSADGHVLVTVTNYCSEVCRV